MAVERGPTSGRMPESFLEQIKLLPKDIKARKQICFDLAARVYSALKLAGIEVEGRGISIRVKSPSDIMDKTLRRKTTAPQRDIYGIRVITTEKDRMRVAEAIQQEFPNTPDVFANGMPTVRDYSDPLVKEKIKRNYNPTIGEEYSAMHVNIIFMREDLNIFDIGEVQIMTPQELEIADKTREKYETLRSRPR